MNGGQSGDLPSGEGYIAPVEGSAEGEVYIDGSFVGFGTLQEPVMLTFEKGLMVRAEGPIAEKLNEILGEGPKTRNLAELGVGTNDCTRVKAGRRKTVKLKISENPVFSRDAA